MGKSHITISSSNSLLALSYCHLGCLRSLSFRCKEHCLHPNQSVLFTWDEPSASREFVWFVKGSKERITTDLSQVSTLVVVVVVDLFTTLAFFSLFFSVLQHISRLPRTFDPVRLTDFVSQSCEKFDHQSVFGDQRFQ